MLSLGGVLQGVAGVHCPAVQCMQLRKQTAAVLWSAEMPVSSNCSAQLSVSMDSSTPSNTVTADRGMTTSLMTAAEGQDRAGERVVTCAGRWGDSFLHKSRQHARLRIHKGRA
jgi:hypothetical protein